MKICKETLEDLGPFCTYEASEILLEQIEKRKRKEYFELELLQDCSNTLKSYRDEYEASARSSGFYDVSKVLPMEPFITRKAHVLLADILLKEKRHFKKNFDSDLHAIIFVQRRCTAVILSRLINLQVQADVDTFQGIKSDYVLGHGIDENAKLADAYMKSKKQNEILQKFRNGKFNVLVSTSVVEEGLDVRKCNIVVRFDRIYNYREYAQSKGRARAQHSKFIVMAENSDRVEVEKDLKVMRAVEKVIFSLCQDRVQPTREEISKSVSDECGDVESLIPTYYVPSGARIAYDTAIPLLYRYCSMLPHDQYTNPSPIFAKEQRKDPLQHKCFCLLPMKFPLEQREFESDWFDDEDNAKRQICMKICILLHQNKELDDEYLNPIRSVDSDSEDEDDDEGNNGKAKEGTRKSRAYYQRKIPSVLSPDDNFYIGNYDLYAISLVLSEPNDHPSSYDRWPLWYTDNAKGFGVFLPKGLPEIEPIYIYSKTGQITAELIKMNPPTAFRCAQISLDQVFQFHQKVMNACASKYTNGNIEFDPNKQGIFKGILVPLKSSVMNEIVRNDRSESLDPLDTTTLLKIDTGYIKTNGKDFNFQDAVIQKDYGDPNQMKRLYYVIDESSTKGSDIMEGTEKTFQQYYMEKYDRHISGETRLIKVVLATSRVDFSDVGSRKESKRQRFKELLIPELCKKATDVPVDLHMRMQFLPHFFFMLECTLNATYLSQSINHQLKCETRMTRQGNSTILDLENSLYPTVSTFPSTYDLLQCLTTRQAKFGFDLERLEMLGDSFLKLAITINLFYKYPKSDEGKLSTSRKHCISNKNLSRVAKQKDLHQVICNSQFGCINPDSKNLNPVTVWLPPSYKRMKNDTTKVNKENDTWMDIDDQLSYQEVQDKSLADSVEALIGAYYKNGGVNLALEFMQKYLHLNVLYSSITEKDKKTSSMYADYPRVEPIYTDQLAHMMYERMKLDRLESRINYKFREKEHIVRAMTHLSYNTGELNYCYQEYEFLGDAILDFLVTLHVYLKRPNLSPGDLTSIRSALVNNNTFGLLAAQRNFHGFMFHESPALFSTLKDFKDLVKPGENDPKSFFASPFVIVPPGSEIGYHAPKVLGDLFESVAGAVFLDSGLDLLEVWGVFYPILKPVIDNYIDDIPLNPYRELQEKYNNLTLEYTTSDDQVTCTVKVDGKDVTGAGQNRKIAKSTAAKRALDQF